jgi:predicted secreted acid phosphatase
MFASIAKSAVIAMLAAAWLAGCATAPTQEMSDARQSVRAAQEAGAHDYASHNLRVAVQYLQEAERELELRYFSQAKHDAVVAKSEAVKARNVTLAIKEAEAAIAQSDASDPALRQATDLLLEALQAAAEGKDKKAFRLADEAKGLLRPPADPP